MKLRRKNKKLKGMTLIECIIAMAILALTGVIVARTGAVTNRLFINTNHLNNKTQAESAIGSVRNTTKLNEYCTANSVSNGEQDVTFTVGGYAPRTAKRYSTKAADVASSKDCDTDLDNSASLQYYEFN